jgi:hypothetical protein
MAVDVDRVEAAAADSYGSFAGLGHRPSALAVGHAEPSGTRFPLLLAWFAYFLAIAVFDRYAFVQFVSDPLPMIRENGLLENVQLLAIVPALALFAFAGWRGLGSVRIAGALLAMLGAVICLREIDFASATGGIVWLDWLVSLELRDALFAGLGAAMLLYLVAQRRYFLPVLQLGLRWQAWPFAASVLLLAVAEFYLDDLSGNSAIFWEELVETNGYFLFALAAWRHALLVGDHRFDRPV